MAAKALASAVHTKIEADRLLAGKTGRNASKSGLATKKQASFRVNGGSLSSYCVAGSRMTIDHATGAWGDKLTDCDYT